MAAPAVSSVVAGKPLVSGGVLTAPFETDLPNSATGVLDEDFVALGYISEDGLTETAERSTEKVKAWGGDIVKVLQTEFSVTYSFTLIGSTDTDVLRAVYGDAAVTTSGIGGTQKSVKVNGDQLPKKAFVFEVKDGDTKIRIVVPNGQVTEVGEVTYSDGGVVSYQVTVEAFENDEGDNAIKYIDTDDSAGS